ncbi:30S ribosomal protein S6 [Candidatus Liberibacter americanus]|uniref:Small ribosomal subunit protein bS6 n=1 Tax=Candidatus Liberibacter americanus str. Sao Paulo TaxID=1261131 RepID=U6B551_9HYPH|nr:30S ribosomal protein S6 [Candidatus Liberibacter americanus]AHA27718.1 Ribosomal protein S6 [Candidatus Liberibacter americanus str. Sao Paulo]EMS36425.1 30S ribosomal protein S6 [Candidatus Liberibacter americanus PW_SP]
MKLYEHVFLLRQDISTQQIKDAIERFRTLIQANGGEVRHVEEWGMRSIAYRINKHRKSYYVLMNIAAPPKAIHELERRMNIDEDVLRHSTVSVKFHDDSPSLVMQKHDRDARNDKSFERKSHFSEEKTLL